MLTVAMTAQGWGALAMLVLAGAALGLLRHYWRRRVHPFGKDEDPPWPGGGTPPLGW